MSSCDDPRDLPDESLCALIWYYVNRVDARLPGWREDMQRCLPLQFESKRRTGWYTPPIQLETT